VYRLPTEAEWEYGCRAGTSTRFSYGDDPGYTNLTNYAWYWDNSGGETHAVGQKLANPWGLYDMHGNVWEWCQDWYGGYPGGIVLDPQGPDSGSCRVISGGDWHDYPGGCRSARRLNSNFDPDSGRNGDIGFRIVLPQVSRERNGWRTDNQYPHRRLVLFQRCRADELSQPYFQLQVP